MKFQFDNIPALLTMDGHGGYVWACYFIVFSILIILNILPKKRTAQFFKTEYKKIQREEKT